MCEHGYSCMRTRARSSKITAMVALRTSLSHSFVHVEEVELERIMIIENAAPRAEAGLIVRRQRPESCTRCGNGCAGAVG